VAEMRKKNEESMDEYGWLHSGDKGCRGSHGLFKITGRYKELIIGAGGENIAPVPMEDAIKEACDAVWQVIMIGDKRKYNTCLVSLKTEGTGTGGETPGTDVLTGPAKRMVEGVSLLSEARESDDVQKIIENAIAKVNKDPKACQNNAWKIQKFRILPRGLSMDNSEITPTMKMRRGAVEENFKDLIEEMYV